MSLIVIIRACYVVLVHFFFMYKQIVLMLNMSIIIQGDGERHKHVDLVFHMEISAL